MPAQDSDLSEPSPQSNEWKRVRHLFEAELLQPIDRRASGSGKCVRLSVTRAPTQTALSSSKNPSLTTGPPVFIAEFTGLSSGPRPTGKVEFHAGGTLLCRSTVYTVGGVRTHASCGGAPLAVGTHSITATYTGDANFEASGSTTLTQDVQPGSYFAQDVGFEGEAVATARNGWVAGNSAVKAALSTAISNTAFVHDGTTFGMPRAIPSLGGTKTVAVGVDDWC